MTPKALHQIFGARQCVAGASARQTGSSDMKPVRIQRKRTAGYNMQAVSRAVNGLPCITVTRPGRWGNPYDVRVFGCELSMKLFRNTMEGVWDPSLFMHLDDSLCAAASIAHHAFLKRLGAPPLEIIGRELGGHNLSCFCAPQLACHADILLELSSYA